FAWTGPRETIGRFPKVFRRVVRSTMRMMSLHDEQPFYRIAKLPPYVFAVVNEMRARLRAAQHDVIDLGMGNPDGPTPRPIVNKLVEAARNARNHRYSVSRGVPNLRLEITRRYRKNYNVDLD